MIEKNITLINKFGLHTRAAAKLVDLAKKFQSKIEFVHEQHVSNCKSIMAMILLGAKKGTTLNLVIAGTDETEATAAIVKLVNERFGEEE